jgi:exopolyphosphatase / guanosine-5'-triphosphate,3'-diphosphate pyrophosphatase
MGLFAGNGLHMREFGVLRGRMSSGPVAVIDIGSNSIKALVAARGNDGSVVPLKIQTIDARIGAGISRTNPELSDEAISRGVEAVRALLADVSAFQPVTTILVATSAVRDARNGGEFRQRVREATGREIRILTGDEEAALIGRGLIADPALTGLQNFYVFDLGGGSLECLSFRSRQIEQAVSLQLGCVRLTEQFVADSSCPLANLEREQIGFHTRTVLEKSGFNFSLPSEASAVGTGGTVTTVRTILAAKTDQSFEAVPRTVTVEMLRELLAAIGSLPLVERKQIPGLPPARADVFPTAIATLIAVAEAGRFRAFENSVYNLRYGLAAELLGRRE